jgi:hypothetical protein
MNNAEDEARIRGVVAARGLVAVMNDTKWRELVAAVKRLPFAPAFQIKDVLGEAPVPPSFDADVWYEGDWDEGLLPYYGVEWIRVRPRLVRDRGKYAAAQVEDIESAFVAVLREVGVPHRKRGDSIEIVGYADTTAGLHV